jgi:hypothetical protein
MPTTLRISPSGGRNPKDENRHDQGNIPKDGRRPVDVARLRRNVQQLVYALEKAVCFQIHFNLSSPNIPPLISRSQPRNRRLTDITAPRMDSLEAHR